MKKNTDNANLVLNELFETNSPKKITISSNNNTQIELFGKEYVDILNEPHRRFYEFNFNVFLSMFKDLNSLKVPLEKVLEKYKKVAVNVNGDIENHFDVEKVDINFVDRMQFIYGRWYDNPDGFNPILFQQEIVPAFNNIITNNQHYTKWLKYYVKDPSKGIDRSIQKILGIGMPDYLPKWQEGVMMKTLLNSWECNIDELIYYTEKYYVNLETGEIVKDKKPKKSSKSVDVSIITNNIRVHLILKGKITPHIGGSQDNEDNDVITSLESVTRSGIITYENEKPEFVIAVLDGEYFKKHQDKLNKIILASNNINTFVFNSHVAGKFLNMVDIPEILSGENNIINTVNTTLKKLNNEPTIHPNKSRLYFVDE